MKKTLREVDIPDGQGTVSLIKKDDTLVIERIASRARIRNNVSRYEYIDRLGNSYLREMTEEAGNEILDRIESGSAYSSAYIFYEDEAILTTDLEITDMEHQYTSTGIKFWRHQEHMFNYKNDDPSTVISTHISPEGACNLKCPYCSVTYRDTHYRIELEVIQDYVEKLQTRGLKAVILTGGGEPTLYKKFNELVQWLKYDRGLSVALITNGTQHARFEPKTMAAFSWVRVSINIFDGWVKKISLPIEHADPNCIIGCSMVYTVEHEATQSMPLERHVLFENVAQVANNVGGQYVRLLPNCLLEQKDLIAQHKSLDLALAKFNDTRFFHQHKIHGAPKYGICHQAYFRPYLSEEVHVPTGKPGTVYPCDSVVLNDSYQHFAEEYQICHASDILKFLDREIEMRFDPRERCKGCVFTNNVNMLGDWKVGKIDRFAEFSEALKHEEFV
jgi:organic radical activating enzyme